MLIMEDSSNRHPEIYCKKDPIACLSYWRIFQKRMLPAAGGGAGGGRVGPGRAGGGPAGQHAGSVFSLRILRGCCVQ
jgi:hypothetical protein